MNAATEKVDVLAVLASACGDLQSRREGDDYTHTDMCARLMAAEDAALSAVAELVECAKAARLEASRLRGDTIPADTLADLDAALRPFTEGSKS